MISIVKLDLSLCYEMEYEIIYSEIRLKVLLLMEHVMHNEVGGDVMLLKYGFDSEVGLDVILLKRT